MRDLSGISLRYTLTGMIFAQDLLVPLGLPQIWVQALFTVFPAKCSPTLGFASTWSALGWDASLQISHCTFTLQLAALCLLGPQHLKQMPFVRMNFLRSSSGFLRNAEHWFNKWLVPCYGHSSAPSEPVAPVVVSVFLMTTVGSFLDELRSLELVFAFSERSNWNLGHCVFVLCHVWIWQIRKMEEKCSRFDVWIYWLPWPTCLASSMATLRQ